MRRAVLLACLVASLLGSDALAQTEQPSRVAVVVAVGTSSEDGQPLLDPENEAVADQAERLTRIADGLVRLQTLADTHPLAVAVAPLFLEELSIVSHPAAAHVYSTLINLAMSSPVLSMPYPTARLHDLVDIGAELRAGDASLSSDLGVEPVDIVYPPGLSLDDDALGELGARTVLYPAKVGDRPRRVGEALMIPATTPPDDADTVEVLDAAYGPDEGSVLVVPPEPDSVSVVAALGARASIELVDIRDLTTAAPEGTVELEELVEQPDDERRVIERAQEAIEQISSYTLDTNPLLDTLTRRLAWARSTAVWLDEPERARSYATAVVERVNAERELIRPEDGNVTLTSQRGQIPVTVINLASYPVEVVVAVSSARLTFPEGMRREVTIPPRGETITFVAEARSTGSFPMTVAVTNVDGSVRFGSTEVTVRSTGANTSALVLTIGAAVFLAGWTLRRFVRRRRAT